MAFSPHCQLTSYVSALNLILTKALSELIPVYSLKMSGWHEVSNEMLLMFLH